MKTYCRRMDISGENFIRKYIAAFIYDKLENGNMPSIFAYYGSISKNEARRRLENSPEFVASVIDQIAYEMSWHLKTRTVREHIYMVVPEEKLVKNVDIVDGMSGKIRTLGLQMDDIILFGSNKKDLHKAMLLVIEFVKSTLCLKIKDSWSLFRTGYVDRNGKQKGRDLDYMGLVFHGQNLIKRCYSGKTVTIRNVSTRIRASIFLKARRKIHRFAKKIKNKKIIGSKFAMSTIAYNGWFVTTDSFLVRVAECWDQLISMAKNIISRYAKQKSYAMEKYYKKWRKLNYA